MRWLWGVWGEGAASEGEGWETRPGSTALRRKAMELGTFPYLIHLPLNQTVRLHFYFPFPYSNPSLHNQSGAISSRGATGRYFRMNYVVFFFFFLVCFNVFLFSWRIYWFNTQARGWKWPGSIRPAPPAALIPVNHSHKAINQARRSCFSWRLPRK